MRFAGQKCRYTETCRSLFAVQADAVIGIAAVLGEVLNSSFLQHGTKRNLNVALLPDRRLRDA